MKKTQLGGRAVLCDSLLAPEVVYGLVDPKHPEIIRYVGRTVTPQERYMAHCIRPSGARIGAWVADLMRRGREPAMVEIERSKTPQAPQKAGGASPRERYWITELRKIGQADLNTVPKWWQEDDEWLSRLTGTHG
jgi:hypothetical protein